MSKFTRKSLDRHLRPVEEIVGGIRVRFSRHFIERWIERIAPIVKDADCNSRICQAINKAVSDAWTKVKVLQRKVRVEIKYNDVDLVLVAAPLRRGKGLELVTLWSPSLNPKKV